MSLPSSHSLLSLSLRLHLCLVALLSIVIILSQFPSHIFLLFSFVLSSSQSISLPFPLLQSRSYSPSYPPLFLLLLISSCVLYILQSRSSFVTMSLLSFFKFPYLSISQSSSSSITLTPITLFLLPHSYFTLISL